MGVVVGPGPHEPAPVSERGLSLEHGKVRAGRDLRCLQERVSCGWLIPRACPCVAQRNEEHTPFLRHSFRLYVQTSQSERIQSSGFLVGQQRDRVVARALRVVDRATGVSTRQRFEEVVCKLREVRLRIGCAETLEDLPGPQVRRSSVTCGECFVQGVADERVREAKPAGRWRVGEYACRDRLVEQFESSRLRRSLPPRRAPWSRTPDRGSKQPRGGDDSRLSAAAAVDRLPLGWCPEAGGRGEPHRAVGRACPLPPTAARSRPRTVDCPRSRCGSCERPSRRRGAR